MYAETKRGTPSKLSIYQIVYLLSRMFAGWVIEIVKSIDKEGGQYPIRKIEHQEGQ
ncbi:MAG: hypothetical protein WC649_10525 [Desulfobacteria bacterium]